MTVKLTKTGAMSGEIDFSTTLQPEPTFDYLSDFTKHTEWTEDLVALEPTSPGLPGVGSRYRGVERLNPGAEMKEPTFAEITGFEHPRLIEWRLWSTNKKGETAMQSHWAFEIVPHGKGSHVTYRYSLEAQGISSKLFLRASSAVADKLMGGAGLSPKNLTKRAEQLQLLLDVRSAVNQL